MTVPPVLWRPSAARIERATITGYTRWLEQTRGLGLPDYASLWEWSTTDLEGFWASIWERFDVAASTPYERVLGSRAMPGAEWFPGATLNYAANVLRVGEDDMVAIRHASELRPLEELTRGRLRDEVAHIAGGLRGLGVRPGDRVAAYLPNIPEAVVGFLACASIGAIWSSCSPDFGARSVVDRFAQIEPRILLTVDGYRYGGKDFDRTDVVRELLAALPTVEHTVVLGYLDPGRSLSSIGAALTWDDLRQRGEGVPLDFEQLPFDHPLWVLYSSGTTGLPKAIVHGHGGILLELLKMMHLHVDLHAEDRLLLVHDDRLDDVELPRRRPAHRRLDRPLRRQSRRSRSGRALGPRRGGRNHVLRHERRLRQRLPEGGAATRRGQRPLGAPLGRLDRLSALPGGVRLGVRDARRRDLALLHLRRHRCRDGVRRRRSDPARLPRRAPGARARREGGVVEPGRTTARRRGRRARPHRADAVDAGLLLGRRGRHPLPRELLRDVPRGLASRRLDRADRPGHGDHLRPLRRDDQPWWGPNGDERDLSRGAHRRRGDRRARGRPAAPGNGRLHAALRRPPPGVDPRRRARRAHPHPDPGGLLAAACPGRRRADRRGPRGRSPARCSSYP